MSNDIYFIEVCDYESCWYDSIWEEQTDAINAFDEYKLNKKGFEQIKRLGHREINCKVNIKNIRLIKEVI